MTVGFFGFGREAVRRFAAGFFAFFGVGSSSKRSSSELSESSSSSSSSSGSGSGSDAGVSSAGSLSLLETVTPDWV